MVLEIVPAPAQDPGLVLSPDLTPRVALHQALGALACDGAACGAVGAPPCAAACAGASQPCAGPSVAASRGVRAGTVVRPCPGVGPCCSWPLQRLRLLQLPRQQRPQPPSAAASPAPAAPSSSGASWRAVWWTWPCPCLGHWARVAGRGRPSRCSRTCPAAAAAPAAAGTAGHRCTCRSSRASAAWPGGSAVGESSAARDRVAYSTAPGSAAAAPPSPAGGSWDPGTGTPQEACPCPAGIVGAAEAVTADPGRRT